MQSLRTPIKVIFLQIIVCLSLSGSVWAETFTGKLVHVVDGDTVDVMFDGKARRIRLADIDCPESKQAYGKNLNHELVVAGLAWWYRKYSDDETIGRMEEEARGKRAGLWQDPEAAPPWEFRKRQ